MKFLTTGEIADLLQMKERIRDRHNQRRAVRRWLTRLEVRDGRKYLVQDVPGGPFRVSLDDVEALAGDLPRTRAHLQSSLEHVLIRLRRGEQAAKSTREEVADLQGRVGELETHAVSMSTYIQRLAKKYGWKLPTKGKSA